MSQGTRLSAFAKRRKIEHDVVSSTTPTPEKKGVIESNLASAIEDGDEASQAQSSRVKPRTRRKRTAQPVTRQVDAQNPYGALAQDEAAQFKGTREIEQLSPTSIRVRLSQGSSCTFAGKAKLWVRDGTLSVYGATLKTSPTIRNLSASESSSLPLLTAVSETVEFQLESLMTATKPGQNLELQGVEITTAQDSKQTFSVTSQDKSALPPLDISSFEDLTQIVYNTSDVVTGHTKEPLESQKRFFIAGKRSNSTAIATVALTNILLSEQIRSGQCAGVAILDLDHINPFRSVPGTIGLSVVKQFLLEGTNLYDNHKNTSTLLQSIWVSATDSTKFDQMRGGALLEMLENDGILADTPVVVRGGAWIVHATSEHNLRLVQELDRSKIIYVDSTQSSQYFQNCKRMSELFGQELDVRPAYSETSWSPSAEHKACMQAWMRSDKLMHVHELSFRGEDKAVNFFAVQGGSLRPIDVLDVLTGALVAVVLIRDEDVKASLVEASSKESPPVTTVGAEPFKAPIPISPRTVIGATCLGLGVVKSVNVSAAKLWLATEIELKDLTNARQAKQQVGLVLEKPGEGGRFSRDNLKL